MPTPDEFHQDSARTTLESILLYFQVTGGGVLVRLDLVKVRVFLNLAVRNCVLTEVRTRDLLMVAG